MKIRFLIPVVLTLATAYAEDGEITASHDERIDAGVEDEVELLDEDAETLTVMFEDGAIATVERSEISVLSQEDAVDEIEATPLAELAIPQTQVQQPEQ